jgi:murein DD-endopeptidase MepM/ murein hydrolase activator NlpD
MPNHPAVKRAGCLGLVLAILLLVALFELLTGPRDLDAYPPRETSPYLLPWPAGVTYLCVQGNNAVVSHRDADGEHAWDFAMPVGSDVLAARAGTVVRIVDEHDGRGADRPNNLVHVDHGDGTTGRYLHLQKGGARVEVGDTVRQGQRLALSGNVGRSLLPHLHFEVRRGEATIPVSFRDVTRDRGVPRMFARYTSGNRAP